MGPSGFFLGEILWELAEVPGPLAGGFAARFCELSPLLVPVVEAADFCFEDWREVEEPRVEGMVSQVPPRSLPESRSLASLRASTETR